MYSQPLLEDLLEASGRTCRTFPILGKVLQSDSQPEYSKPKRRIYFNTQIEADNTTAQLVEYLTPKVPRPIIH